MKHRNKQKVPDLFDLVPEPPGNPRYNDDIELFIINQAKRLMELSKKLKSQKL